MSTSDQVRIVVADDHPLYRRGLSAMLNAQEGWEVVAEESDGLGAVTAVASSSPDVVVLDLNMPGLDGIEATRRIVAGHPDVGVLVLTMYDDDSSVFAAMRAGARGYLLKGADQEEIVRAVSALLGGEAIFGPTVAARIIDFFASPRPRPTETVFPELTSREHEVLDLMAAGCSNPEVAETLVLSPKTVRNHVSAIFAKLQVASRTEAIIRARDAGLGR